MKKILSTLIITLWFWSSAYAGIVVDDTGNKFEPMKNPKVVSLSWPSTEMVLALGIKPVAVADIDSYKKWINLNDMPEGVVEVGPRKSLALEKIASLKPDIIIIGSTQAKYLEKLQKIAPVYLNGVYGNERNPWDNMERNFLKIGTLLNKEQNAKKIMEQTYDFIKKQGEKITDKSRPIASARFWAKGDRFNVNGENSMVVSIMKIMGLKNANQQPTNAWGLTTFSVEKMSKLPQNMRLIYIDDGTGGYERVSKSPLWKTYDFAKNNRIHRIPNVWTFGGPISAQKLAEHISNNLK